MPKRIEIAKHTVFGEWITLGPLEKRGSGKATKLYYEAMCTCGKVSWIRGETLVGGYSGSCLTCANTHHGLTKTVEYRTWADMKDRCSNPKNNNFHRYGGRGIKVAREWVDSFETFLKDMGKRPSKDLSLDRINNDKGYSKNNCRWATTEQQANNTSRNVSFIYKGKKQTAKELAELAGIKLKTMQGRIYKYGRVIGEAHMKPIKRYT